MSVWFYKSWGFVYCVMRFLEGDMVMWSKYCGGRYLDHEPRPFFTLTITSVPRSYVLVLVLLVLMFFLVSSSWSSSDTHDAFHRDAQELPSRLTPILVRVSPSTGSRSGRVHCPLLFSVQPYIASWPCFADFPCAIPPNILPERSPMTRLHLPPVSPETTVHNASRNATSWRLRDRTPCWGAAYFLSRTSLLGIV